MEHVDVNVNVNVFVLQTAESKGNSKFKRKN